MVRAEGQLYTSQTSKAWQRESQVQPRGKAEVMRVITERLEAEEGGGGEIKAMKLQTEVHKAALGQWQPTLSLFFIIKNISS